MAHSWTQEKIEALDLVGLRNLRRNAEERGAEDVTAMCDVALGGRAKTATRRPRPAKTTLAHSKRVSRKKAMEMRGVKLRNPIWSWGGIRESDGVPVLCLWAAEIAKTDTGSEARIWGENVDGSRPWADTKGGKERLEHARIAVEKGGEALLIYGQRQGIELPAGTASKVEGADPYSVIRFRVEQRGNEYWATWDKSGETKMEAVEAE